jgi:hypothetical protein
MRQRQRQHNHIANGSRDNANDDARSYSYPLEDAPKNTPEDTERIERIIDRVIEEHRETIEKLADE